MIVIDDDLFEQDEQFVLSLSLNESVTFDPQPVGTEFQQGEVVILFSDGEYFKYAYTYMTNLTMCEMCGLDG